MSGLLIGSAVIGGAAGFGGAMMSKKKKANAQAVISPVQTPEGALYKSALEEGLSKRGNLYGNLEDILAKRGYGYTPSTISSLTAPYATARRENFKNYEVPLISSQASARGLGRSTIPVNRIALSGQEAERDIESRVAELTRESEQLKADQFESALSKYGNLYENALSKYGPFVNEITDSENAKRKAAFDAQNLSDEIVRQNNQNLVGGTVMGAFGGLGGGAGGTPMSFLQGIGGSFSGGMGGQGGGTSTTSQTVANNNQTMALIDAYMKRNRRTSASVSRI